MVARYVAPPPRRSTVAVYAALAGSPDGNPPIPARQTDLTQTPRPAARRPARPTRAAFGEVLRGLTRPA